MINPSLLPQFGGTPTPYRDSLALTVESESESSLWLLPATAVIGCCKLRRGAKPAAAAAVMPQPAAAAAVMVTVRDSESGQTS